jgi:hypothetical protein
VKREDEGLGDLEFERIFKRRVFWKSLGNFIGLRSLEFFIWDKGSVGFYLGNFRIFSGLGLLGQLYFDFKLNGNELQVNLD